LGGVFIFFYPELVFKSLKLNNGKYHLSMTNWPVPSWWTEKTTYGEFINSLPVFYDKKALRYTDALVTQSLNPDAIGYNIKMDYDLAYMARHSTERTSEGFVFALPRGMADLICFFTFPAEINSFEILARHHGEERCVVFSHGPIHAGETIEFDQPFPLTGTTYIDFYVRIKCGGVDFASIAPTMGCIILAQNEINTFHTANSYYPIVLSVKNGTETLKIESPTCVAAV
jgi:hypothetical protein